MLGIPVLFDAGQNRIEFSRHHEMAAVETYRPLRLVDPDASNSVEPSPVQL